MKALPRGVLALGLSVACQVAGAFGGKTHLWIGSQIVSELRQGCSLTLAGRPYPLAPDLCQAITANPENFYAGTLGPDIYPDLISGQDTTHSGVKNGWETAEFLEHVVASARTAPERAYAAGYLVHAASDIFGHSYVNGYAGDVWNMGDESAVELRHTVIEKYIDAHLPPAAAGDTTFHAPADFVRDTLVHNGATQAQYRRTAFARHLASMTNVKATVDDLAVRAEALSGRLSSVLADAVERAGSLAVQLVDGEAALALASAALGAPQSLATAQRAAVETERQAAAEAAGAVDQHERRLAELASHASVQQQIAAAASAAARQAKAGASEMRARLAELQDRIRSVPPRVVVSVCHNVTDKVCDTICPADSSNPICAVCKLPREVCSAAERTNEEHQRLNDQIVASRQRLDDLEAAETQETAKADAATASADALLQEQATEAAAGPGIAAARDAAQASYRAAERQLASIAGTVAGLQRRVDELRARIEANRKELVDTRAIADQVRTVVDRLDLVSQLFRGWQRGIDHAGSGLVRASDRVGQAMLGGRLHLFSEYRRWLACEGAAYMAAPYRVADAPCIAETAAQRLHALVHELGVALPAPLKDLYALFGELKDRIDVELRAVITGATTELVRFVSDPTTADFADLLMNPQHATRAKLNEVLASAGGAKGKSLLVFDDGADLIDRDLGLRNDTLDPDQFAALSSAITLAKLSLLDQAATRRLVLDVGGLEAQTRYDAGQYDVGRSILISATRSLDGNEQWQPYGLPYPRSSGSAVPANASDRHFGFGPGDSARHGLPLFVDPVLRKRVFLQLFPKQIHGEVAKRPEMAAGRYPFPICDGNPFPVTFLPDGEPAPGDESCSSQPPR